MIRKCKWLFVFSLIMIIISLLLFNINQVKHKNDQIDYIVIEQIETLQGIKAELIETTTPIFQSYGRIKLIQGMNRILVRSNNQQHQDYGHDLADMLRGLEESFNTFTTSKFNTNADRKFLSDQVSLVLETIKKDNIDSFKVYRKIMSETTEYYENYQKSTE